MSSLAGRPTLHGARVVLRPATGDDAAVLGQLMQDPEIGRLTGSTSRSGGPAPVHDVQVLRRLYDTWAQADDRVVWVVIDRRDGAVVGEVVLNDLDERNRCCGFRIWLGRRGQGLGREATALAVEHAFTTAQLNRVELEVYDFNPRARAVYEKAGFVHEGTRRQALLFDDVWIDAHLMAQLREEWPGRRASEP
jgi:RimJ/RimL family protein N-acetyltransferase